jgi:hypothetical protein
MEMHKIISAGFAGLAGGAVIATAISGSHGLVIATAGSLVGAAITGTSEYSRGKREAMRKIRYLTR